MMKLIFAAAVVAALSACSAKVDDNKNGDTISVSKVEYETLKANQKDDCRLSNPVLTNDQIISETHKCESNGLLAEALVCTGDADVVKVQCKPKSE